MSSRSKDTAKVRRGMAMKRRQQAAALVLVGALGLAGYLYWPGQASAQAVFSFHASGFPQPMVADSAGRLLHAGAGMPQRLAADRWVAVDFDGKASRWFDDTGRPLRTGPYIEIRDDFTRNPSDPDRTPLRSTWSHEGMALLRPDGTQLTPWQADHGEWLATPHPSRYAWQPRSGGEIVFDAQGTERLRLTAEQMRVAGPFPRQALYLICGFDTLDEPCALRDETGQVRWQAPVDALRELDGGGWLARRYNAWFRVDEQGTRLDDRVYVDGQYFPRFRYRESAGEPQRWPIWMTEYTLAADGQAVREETAVSGFMQSDGRFDPVPGARQAHELCPGTWRVNDHAEEPNYWLVDAKGQRIGEMKDDYWQAVDAHPQLYLAGASGRHEVLIDCNGKRLFEDPQVRELRPLGPGFAGVLADENGPRLWLDAQLGRHLLPEGSHIDQVDAEGRLLLVRHGEAMRLYSLARGEFVGEPFDHAEQPVPHGLVFNRDGYYGFMDAEGRELLAPVHYEISPWGKDRLWASRYLEEGSLLGLHDIHGKLIGSWRDMTVNLLQTWRGEQDVQAVAELIGKTFQTPEGAYFPQQWVDRDGNLLLTALQCPGEDPQSVLADGAARLEPADGEPLFHNGRCEMPAEIRAAIAIRRGE